jgi:hypothetical protein
MTTRRPSDLLKTTANAHECFLDPFGSSKPWRVSARCLRNTTQDSAAPQNNRIESRAMYDVAAFENKHSV